MIYACECAIMKSEIALVKSAGLSACTQWPAPAMVISDAFGKKFNMWGISVSLI
jgi:hypothetical protein